jgi:6-phosphogluconolactonase
VLSDTSSRAKNLFALVSNAADGDISVIHFDHLSGNARLVERCPVGERVMPMATTPDKRYLYAATRGSSPSIVRFSFDAGAGHLAHCETVHVKSSMAYLTIDPSGRYLLGASYGEDLIDVYALDQLRTGNGTPRQSVAHIRHAHAVVISSDNRFAYASSLGDGQVVCLQMRPENSEAPLLPIEKIPLDSGFGPRHLRVSPCQGWLYVSSEFRGTVAVYRRDRETGRLTPQSESPRPVSLRGLRDGIVRPLLTSPVQPDPATLASLVWAADIQVRPDGRFIYVSERTLSKLLVYRVAADGAALEYAGYVDTEEQPRGFKIDPTGTFLVACGEKSANVSVYRIDFASGEPILISRCAGGRGANWVELFEQDNSPAA